MTKDKGLMTKDKGLMTNKNCDEFVEALSEAQNQHKVEQVKALLKRAKPLIATDRCIYLWAKFAKGYLALDAAYLPLKALSYLEPLLDEVDLPATLYKRVLMGLGIIYEVNEQWDKAEQCYKASLRLYKQEQNVLRMAKVFNNLAILHFKKEDYTACIGYSKQSIALLETETTKEGYQISLGRALNELGLAYQHLGQYTKAHQAFEAYLTICKRWHYIWGIGIAYQNLGSVAYAQNKYQHAESYYTQAQPYLIKAKNNRTLSFVLYKLGMLALQANNVTQAEDLFAQALELAQQTQTYKTLIGVSLTRADLYQQHNNLKLALQENKRAVDTIESLRANISIPESRIELQAAQIKAYEQMVYRLYLDGAYAEAFYYAEMAKSRVLIELLTHRQIRSPDNIPTVWLESVRTLQLSLRQMYQAGEDMAPKIAELEDELRALHEQIAGRNAEYASLQTVNPITAAEVATLLPSNSLLIEYFTCEDVILAFILSPTAPISLIALDITVSELKRLLHNNDQAYCLSNIMPDKDNRLNAAWVLEDLYEDLIEPLEEVIEQAELLCIVPHGPLHYIPFHALYCSGADGSVYLGGASERVCNIVYAPSASTLFNYCQQKPLSSQTGCLAIGYNSTNLHHAEAEANRIALLTKGKSLIGSKATWANFLTEVEEYRYVHISTHACFKPNAPLESFIHFKDKNATVADVWQSLALKAELVSLSACTTGSSKVLRGDELIGLTRAFLYAGCPSILVSLWVVDDFATRLLMERFYFELERLPIITNAHKATALRHAQHYIKTLTVTELRPLLNEIEETQTRAKRRLRTLAYFAGYNNPSMLQGNECLLAHPFYWAAFFLVGDRL